MPATYSSYYDDFATAVLRNLGAPTTQNNIQALVSWIGGEAGWSGTNVAVQGNNPLNIKYGVFTSYGITPDGKRNITNSVDGTQGYGTFSSLDRGAAATAEYLRRGASAHKYGPIIEDLQQNAPATSTLNAIAQSDWSECQYGLKTTGRCNGSGNNGLLSNLAYVQGASSVPRPGTIPGPAGGGESVPVTGSPPSPGGGSNPLGFQTGNPFVDAVLGIFGQGSGGGNFAAEVLINVFSVGIGLFLILIGLWRLSGGSTNFNELAGAIAGGLGGYVGGRAGAEAGVHHASDADVIEGEYVEAPTITVSRPERRGTEVIGPGRSTEQSPDTIRLLTAGDRA